MENERRHAIMRFVLPVTLENIGSVLIGMVFSSLIGNISKSALSAISTANLVINFYSAAFALLSVGCAVLTARLVGAHEKSDASRTIEQSLLMTLVFSGLLTLASITLARPLMKLLMPTAEAQLLDEAVSYFRICALSLPFLYIYTLLSGVLRASGNSRAPFIITTVQNLAQVALAFIFIKLIPLEVTGAGISMVLCRIIGAGMALTITLRSHAVFFVRIRNILRLHMPTIKRILRLGVPASLESGFVQFGYLLANSLAVGLGTQQAAIYNVTNTLQGFANMPNSICSAISTTFVGQYLGADKRKEAKRFGYMNLMTGVPVIILLYIILNLLSPYLAPLYTTDPDIASGAVTCLWVLMFFSVPAQSINTIDPALRAGGDGKFVMVYTLVGVWGVRLPLSWLLAYHFDMGVIGIYIANIISLYARTAAGLFRYAGNKWMHARV